MKNYTDIRFLVDRSGSMSSISKSMIEGFGEFINREKLSGDSAVVSVYLFDDKYETLFEKVSINDVGALVLVPRGMTALFDGIGKTIDTVGKQLSELSEEDRPNKVMIVIITDGHENASKEFAFAKIQEMVKHQQDIYSWEFVFLGANIDSFAVGGSFGVARGSTMNYTATDIGVNSAWTSLGNSYRTMKSMVNEEVKRAGGCCVSNVKFEFDAEDAPEVNPTPTSKRKKVVAKQ